MNNLIYFFSQKVSATDKFLCNPAYEHHEWFILRDIQWWPSHICSRSHKVSVPWPVADSLAPIPEISHNETRFDVIFDQVAEKFCQQVTTTGRTPYIMWSGGIDSTSILISILKVANKDVLENLVVVCNQKSINENPYFYYHYVFGKLKTVDSDTFEITSNNYNKILLVNGDCAEMVHAPTHTHILAYLNQFDVLNSSWKDNSQLKKSLQTKNPKALNFALDLITESIKYSPVPIETVYDFLWWNYFNFKLSDSLIRAMGWITDQLTADQTEDFWNNTFQRFYLYPEVQVWGMITNNIRRETAHLDVKYAVKKYIHDFDHNDYYYYNKKRCPSPLYTSAQENIFAIDRSWKKYSFENPEDRRLLGQWLNRI
jgi:hypothetical protein